MARPRIRLWAGVFLFMMFAAGALPVGCGTVLGLGDFSYAADDGATSLDSGAAVDSGRVPLDSAMPVDSAASVDAIVEADALGARDGPFTVTNVVGVPQALAVDSQRLYWIASESAGLGSVQTILKDGTGAVSTLAPNEPSPLDIVVSGGVLYWSVNQTPAPLNAPQCLTRSVSTDGGAPTCVATGPFASQRMTTNGEYIIVLSTNGMNQNVGYATALGAYQSIATQGMSMSVAATSTDIFLGNPNGKHVDELTIPALMYQNTACNNGCGAPVLDMTVDRLGMNLFWITPTGVFTTPTDNMSGSATELAELPSAGQRVTCDSSYVYVTTMSSVYAVPISGADGGPPMQKLGTGAPFGIAVDNSYVYWADGAGTIRAVPVPVP